MATEHERTPGPWEVEKYERTNGRIEYRIINSAHWETVARIEPTDGGDEELPNARLIAAAPALLEALKLAEAAMTKSPAFNPWDLGPLSTLERVRQAIAEAEGQ